MGGRFAGVLKTEAVVVGTDLVFAPWALEREDLRRGGSWAEAGWGKARQLHSECWLRLFLVALLTPSGP